ncbi:hypothetical protein BCR35DRAFT_355650 [Leucosporidium creatinivorum]|uniref:Potassium channel domain-containing protein n=1 Tax=Leucosporidium creatinivorum TaxID=106004 RepID=A0A1Y2DBY0_9BASI|nr:hypothetical protein BCR35DRAFT_355650 [Leucosporidium creatinivorum]
MADSPEAPEQVIDDDEPSAAAPPPHLESNWRRRTHRVASLAAALVAPFSILFALPGLTEHWMVVYDDAGQVVKDRPDPALLIISGSFALALAVLANVALIFRFIGTHTRVATISAMLLLAIQITLNLIALLIFGLEQTDGEGTDFTLSTAYWLTAASSAFALVACLLLILDGAVTGWYKRGGTGLTGKQTSLFLALDVFHSLTWLGSVAFKYLLDVDFLDAIYFTVQTVTTTGFGDITVSTTGARAFVIPFACVGIISFAVVVAFTRSTVLEGLQDLYQARERAILTRLHRRTSLRPLRHLSFYTRSRRKEEGPRSTSEDSDAQHYEVIIKALRAEKRREFRAEALVSFLIVLTVWFVGAAVYTGLEHWTYFIALYFSFVSASTIGYGEITPKTPGGRAFFCAWALVSAVSLTIFLSILADAQFGRHTETHQHSWVHRFVQNIRPSASRERRILVEEEQARSATQRTISEPTSPRFPPPQRSLSAPAVEEEPPSELVRLIREVRRQFDLLVEDGESGAVEEMERVVAKTMESQHVGLRTRDRVATSEELTRFVFLRQLQSKLETLEQKAVDALGEGKCRGEGKRNEGEEKGRAREGGSKEV